MAQVVTVSLTKFTEAVQAAVKSAIASHPKFKVDTPNTISISYLIRGFPLPDGIAAAATLAETQAFANDVAAHVARAQPEALAAAARPGAVEGAVVSVGRHIIVGIPPVSLTVQLER